MANLSNINNKFLVTTGGNVGIGVTGPTAKLDIGGNTAGSLQAIFGRGNSDSNFTVRYTNGITGTNDTVQGTIGLDYANGYWADMAAVKFIRDSTAGELAFYTSATATSGVERMRIDSSGNVGIGVTPESWGTGGDTRAIQISTMTSLSEAFDGTQLASNFYFDGTNDKYIQSDFATSYLQIDGSHRWRYAASGTANANITWSEAMRIDTSGNVGINDTIGYGKLAIKTSGTFTTDSNDLDFSGVNIVMKTTNTATNAVGSGIVWLKGAHDTRKVAAITNYTYGDTDQSGLNFYVQQTSSGSSATLSEAMRINNSGNVGIGETNPTKKIDVYQSSTNFGAADFRHVNGNRILINPSYNYYDAYNHIFRGLNGTDTHLTINNLGNVGIGTTSPQRLLHLRSTNEATGIFLERSANYGFVQYNQVVGSVETYHLGFVNNNTFSSDILVANESGNVGIGTDSPQTKLEVNGGLVKIVENSNTAFYGGDYVRVFGTQSYGFRNSAGSAIAQISLTGNSYFNGGNVGIGITSPSQKLQVDGGAFGFNQGIPATSGATQNGMLRLTSGSSVFGETFDFGMNVAPTYAWMQATNKGNLAVNYNLALNPNGGNVGIGITSFATKLHVKDSQDSSLYSGLKVERSANTTAAYLNAVGGALNLNTDSSMPLKFRILNTSMQTINTDGGRAYAGFGGWRMFEYSYTVSVGNGATVDLFQNTSAHSDLHMVQIAVRMFHSGRTYFVGSGTVGGYGMNITGSGSGATNGGLTSAVVSSGIRKLQISQSSGYTAQATIYIQFRLDSGSGINVLNGTLSSL